jgi:hypothetical protein
MVYDRSYLVTFPYSWMVSAEYKLVKLASRKDEELTVMLPWIDCRESRERLYG